MRIIFMGTPDFAVPALKILLDHGYDIVGVVTAPDKPGGRKGIIESAVKQFAVANGLHLLQPVKLRDSEFLKELAALQADLQVVVAFRMLPEVVWQMPKLGTLNLHGSLLPKYRGAAPINWAIINGEKETGVTTFFLRHEIDTGDLILQRKMDIGLDETAGEIHDRMMMLGAEVVLETVDAIRKGTVVAQPQPDAEATHAPKIFTETCRVNFDQSAVVVHNFIRGLSPFPGAWTQVKDGVFKIYKSMPEPFNDALQTDEHKPGDMVSDGRTYLKVRVRDGYLQLLDVQLEGKRRMPLRDFLNGHKNFL
jgi:methionyl-tRNA formyltransferase